jgi:hypothetical protein
MKKPNLFLVGAPKCGTTSLYYYLREHPEVYIPELKEPHFFAQELKNRNSKVVYAPEQYRKLYQKAGVEKYRGDASVFYLYSCEAAANIRFFCPEAKIIIMLRNPVDMMFSMFRFSLKHGAETVNDFSKALALEEKRKAGLQVPNSVFLEAMLYYRSIADFAPQVERYMNLFPSEQIHIILYDDFAVNRTKTNQGLMDFLGISYLQVDQNNHVNNTDAVEFNSSKFLNRMYPGQMSLIRKVLPETVRQKLQFTKSIIAAPNISNAIPLELKETLIQEFAPKINKLEKLIDKDLSNWLQKY